MKVNRYLPVILFCGFFTAWLSNGTIQTATVQETLLFDSSPNQRRL